MKNSLRHVNFVLIFVYLIYVISPLAYDTVALQPGDVNHRPGDTEWTIKLYAADVILSALLPQSEQDKGRDDESSGDHILLQKKKALRTPAPKIIALPSLRSSKRVKEPPVHEGLDYGTSQPDAGPTCPNGYQFQHSGTSPPAA